MFPGRLIVATTPELFDPFCSLLIEAGATDIPPGPSRSCGSRSRRRCAGGGVRSGGTGVVGHGCRSAGFVI